MSSELREKINKLLIDFDKATRGNPYNSHHRKSTVTELEALIKEEKLSLLEEIYQSNVPEPCEPDCDEVRHARHKGAWAHHLHIDGVITNLRNKIEEQ